MAETDNTKTRRAARKLASREEFRALFERSPIAKILYDARGYPVKVNAAAVALLGVADAVAIARISLFSTPRISDADKGRLREGRAIRYEQRYDFDAIRERGDFLTTRFGVSYLDIHIIPIFLESGGVKEYIGEFVDVTERKRAEEERASTAKFPEENPNPVLRLTPDGDILFANEASKTLLRDGSHASPFNQVRTWAAHAYQSGEACTFDMTLETGAFMLTFVPFAGQKYVNVYGADITARKRAEEALQEAAEAVHGLNEQLRSANQALRIAYETLERRVQERTEEIASMNEELRSRNKRLGDEIAERIKAAETAKERARRIAVLNEIVHVINEAVDRQALFERTLATTVKQFGFDRGLVATVADTGFLDVQCALNVPPVRVEAAKDVSVDDDVYGLAMFRRRELVVMDDVPPDFPSYSFGLRGAFVGIPFVSEDVVIGGVFFNCAKRSFSSEDRELFETIGLELGLAVSKLQAKEQSEQHTAMLDGARDAIVMWDVNDRITYWNHGAERLYGWPRNEAIGKPIHSLLNTKFPEPVTQIRSTLTEHGRWEGELVHTTQSGATVTVESHMTLQSAPGGTPVATLEINNDITQRRGAEQLRASSRYSRNLIEASLDPLVTINAEGKITDVNRATEEVTGSSRDELIGNDFYNYFTEPKKAREGYKRVFSDGIVRDYPLAIRHKSGGVTEVLYNATVYRNEAGEVEGVFAAAREISERKRAEEQLRAASLYARSLIEASLDPLVTISADGKITDVNEATEEVTGFARGELIGSDFSDYFTEPEEARKGYERAFTHGFARDYPLAIRHRSGKVTDVLYNATVYRNEHGQVQGVFAAARDITDRKRVQEELQRYSDHLEDLVEERTAQLRNAERLAGIGETAAMIGHDLRNPLQGLQYIVDLQKLRFEKFPPGKRSAEDWQKEAELFNKISEQVYYMDKIVGDLQDYARPLDPEREAVSVNKLIGDVLESLPRSDGKVEINTNLSDLAVEVEPHLMHRVFSNLVLNAIQAMPDGGVLTITASSADGSVAISISDTGVGIPDEMKDRLFSPLMTGKAKGTGLGLAVVKRIVDAHNGTITFESEKGTGTTFTVTLPVPAAG